MRNWIKYILLLKLLNQEHLKIIPAIDVLT